MILKHLSNVKLQVERQVECQVQRFSYVLIYYLQLNFFQVLVSIFNVKLYLLTILLVSAFVNYKNIVIQHGSVKVIQNNFIIP